MSLFMRKILEYMVTMIMVLNFLEVLAWEAEEPLEGLVIKDMRNLGTEVVAISQRQ